MTYNLNNTNQCNDTIAYEPKIDNKFSLSCGPPMDPSPLVTVIFVEGKENRATNNDGTTFLWDRRDSNIIIKRK